MIQIAAGLVPEVEPYSIDELFINFAGIVSLPGFAKELRETVFRWSKIPVSLGVAPTKTLAKVANHFAKKYPGYKGCCFIDTEEKRLKALRLLPIGNVWGIGNEYEKLLHYHSIHTAYDFTRRSRSRVRRYMKVTGERTWRELQGEPCIPMEVNPPKKKEICTSRSFDKPVSGHLYQPVCGKATGATRCAGAILVYILTNRHADHEPQYYRSDFMELPVPTHDTAELVGYALQGLRRIYRQGYRFQKVGVILQQITPDRAVQGNLFDRIDREKRRRMMKTLDTVNTLFPGKLNLAVQGKVSKGNSNGKNSLPLIQPGGKICLNFAVNNNHSFF